MSDYSPTTEHVRAQYARQENYDEYYEGDLALTPDGQMSAAAFDRWLAAHDAEVRAKVLEEAAQVADRTVIGQCPCGKCEHGAFLAGAIRALVSPVDGEAE